MSETTTAPENDVNKLVEVYIKIRDEKDKIEKAADNKAAELTKQMEVIESELRKILQGTGGSSISCKSGTVFVKEQTSAKVADWQPFIEFVKANDAWQLLNHGVNKTAVKEYLEANESLPPGVDFSRRLDIQIRRK